LIGEPHTQAESQFTAISTEGPVEVVKHREGTERVFKAGDGVTVPTLVARVDPQYSDTAREARVTGTVILEGIVETDGTMSVTRVARSLNPDLDHNAIYALEQWRFEPGKANGVAVPVQLNVEITFNLK
jgi:protein TonB